MLLAMYIQVEILWRLRTILMILLRVHKMISQLLVCLVYMTYIICYIFTGSIARSHAAGI